MNPSHPFEQRLAQSWPPHRWHELTVVLAVSGGADSVGLLRAMLALKQGGEGRLVVAHFNHGLRGQESEDDQAFVEDLSGTLGLPCEVGWGDLGKRSEALGDGLEAAARAARYQFLRATAERLGARYVATAHTADDQAETVLHRILRGTGIRGLAGMQRARLLGPAVSLIRPLLDFRRSELISYLDDVGQPFRDDSSNDDLAFTRNRLRHDLLPRLAEAVNSEVIDALLRLGSLARDVQVVVDRLVDELAEASVAGGTGGCWTVLRRPLSDQPRYVIRELLMALWRARNWPLQAMGFDQWEELAAMLGPPNEGDSDSPGKRVFPGGILAERCPDGLRLRPAEGHADSNSSR